MPGQLPFWLAYGRAILVFFVALMAIDWLVFFVWGNWFEWWKVLAFATVIPGLALMVTWDEI